MSSPMDALEPTWTCRNRSLVLHLARMAYLEKISGVSRADLRWIYLAPIASYLTQSSAHASDTGRTWRSDPHAPCS